MKSAVFCLTKRHVLCNLRCPPYLLINSICSQEHMSLQSSHIQKTNFHDINILSDSPLSPIIVNRTLPGRWYSICSSRSLNLTRFRDADLDLTVELRVFEKHLEHFRGSLWALLLISSAPSCLLLSIPSWRRIFDSVLRLFNSGCSDISFKSFKISFWNVMDERLRAKNTKDPLSFIFPLNEQQFLYCLSTVVLIDYDSALETLVLNYTLTDY